MSSVSPETEFYCGQLEASKLGRIWTCVLEPGHNTAHYFVVEAQPGGWPAQK